RDEQERGERALALARSLEHFGKELAEVTDPEPLFRSIAQSALALVKADHATIKRRKGDEFWVVAGAGTGERLVGTHSSSSRGLVAAVIRSRRTAARDDYQKEPTGLEEVKALGVRSMAGVPIVVQGEIVATLMIGRLAVRPFDADDLRALEGLAGHAAVALRNARLLELSRRLESLSREVATETRSLEDVMSHVASDIATAYDTEIVMVSRVKGDMSRVLAPVGCRRSTCSRGSSPRSTSRMRSRASHTTRRGRSSRARLSTSRGSIPTSASLTSCCRPTVRTSGAASANRSGPARRARSS